MDEKKVVSFFKTILCIARIVKLFIVLMALIAFTVIALPYLIAREVYRRQHARH